MSRSIFSAAPVLVAEPETAHSGPELIASLPNPTAGMELASALLADRVTLHHASSAVATGIPEFPSVLISLSRS